MSKKDSFVVLSRSAADMQRTVARLVSFAGNRIQLSVNCMQGVWVTHTTTLFATHIKTNTSKFQFDLDTMDKEPVCGYATANSYLFKPKQI